MTELDWQLSNRLPNGLYLEKALLFFSKILVFSISFFLVANIPEYVNAQRIGIFPYQLYMVSIVVLLASALVSGSLFKISKGSFYIVGWFVALMLCCLLSILLVSRNGLAMDELNKVGLFAGMGASMALVLANRSLATACGYGVLSAVILCAALTYMEFFDPGFNVMTDAFFENRNAKDGVIQRNGGLHGNPNANGYAMTLGMFLAQYFLPKQFRFAFVLFVGFAVFTTVSRSALLLWMLVVSYGFWSGIYFGRSLVSKLTAIVVVAGLYLSLTAGLIPGFLQSVGLEQYMNQGMIERLSGNFFTQEDGSSIGRYDAAIESANQFMDSPILGNGLGTARGEFTDSVGAHNMPLRLGAELGIVGIFVYVSLLLVPLQANSRIGLVFVLFYFFLNMFTHTSFEKSVFAVLIPMGILYFAFTGEKKSRRKKRRRKSSSKRDHFQQVNA